MKQINNKADLLKLANKGKIELCGVKAEIKIYPSSVDGTDFIEIIVDPLSPLHLPLTLGGKWLEYVTDEECAEVEDAIERYKAEAAEFVELAAREATAHSTPDGCYVFDCIPEEIAKDWEGYPRLFRTIAKEKHRIAFIDNDRMYWHTLGVFTVIIDGVKYVPHWSYWLDRSYYIADDHIRSVAERR